MLHLSCQRVAFIDEKRILIVAKTKTSQQTFTCLKSTVETQEQYVKSVQS